MSFVPKKHTYNAHINEVVLGVGDKAVTIGGQNVYWPSTPLTVRSPTRPRSAWS